MASAVWDFAGGTSGKESACQCRRQETRAQPLDREDPLEEEMAPPSMMPFLLGESHGQRSPTGYSPQGRKESDTIEPLSTIALLSVVCIYIFNPNLPSLRILSSILGVYMFVFYCCSLFLLCRYAHLYCFSRFHIRS